MAAEVSILLPNYKTRELTRICLELLQRHTDPARIRLLVVDNDSRDDSVEFLRGVEGIELIERTAVPGEPGHLAHARALDLAFERVDTPFVLSLHTDSMVKRGDWLDVLLQPFDDPRVAGVGSWKLEPNPWYREAARQVEGWGRKLLGKRGDEEGKRRRRQYLRSHCAMFRTDLIRKHGLGFDRDEDTAGRFMHFALEDHGYELVFLPADELLKYMVHLNHATQVLNPEIGGRDRTRRRGRRRIRRHLQQLGVRLPEGL